MNEASPQLRAMIPTRHWLTAPCGLLRIDVQGGDASKGLQSYVLKAAKPAAGHKVP